MADTVISSNELYYGINSLLKAFNCQIKLNNGCIEIYDNTGTRMEFMRLPDGVIVERLSLEEAVESDHFYTPHPKDKKPEEKREFVISFKFGKVSDCAQEIPIIQELYYETTQRNWCKMSLDSKSVVKLNLEYHMDNDKIAASILSNGIVNIDINGRNDNFDNGLYENTSASHLCNMPYFDDFCGYSIKIYPELRNAIPYKNRNNRVLVDFNVWMDLDDGCVVLKNNYTREVLNMRVSKSLNDENVVPIDSIPVSEIVGTDKFISVMIGANLISFKLEKDKNDTPIISELTWRNDLSGKMLIASGIKNSDERVNIRYTTRSKGANINVSNLGKVTYIGSDYPSCTFENGLGNDMVSQMIRSIPHYLAVIGYFEQIYPSIEDIGTILLTNDEIEELVDLLEKDERISTDMTVDEKMREKALTARLSRIQTQYRLISGHVNKTEQDNTVLEKCGSNLLMYYKEYFRDYNEDELGDIIKNYPRDIRAIVAKELLDKIRNKENQV